MFTWLHLAHKVLLRTGMTLRWRFRTDHVRHPGSWVNWAGLPSCQLWRVLNSTMFSQVFMCQLEGSKHWRLYGPREEGERLPRFSSPNFSQDEVSCFISKSRDDNDFDRWVSLYWTLCSTLETCSTFPGAPFIRLVSSKTWRNMWTDLIFRATACLRSTACTSQSRATSSTPGPICWRNSCLQLLPVHPQITQHFGRVCPGIYYTYFKAGIGSF